MEKVYAVCENFRKWLFEEPDDCIEKTVDMLKREWFTDNRYVENTDFRDSNDSCNFHAISHEDTEILGIFCDRTAIHGDGLKDILIRGYLARILK